MCFSPLLEPTSVDSVNAFVDIFLQDDVLYLYKAVEALIASNRANPVHEGGGVSEPVTSSCNVVIDVDKPIATNGVTPERRTSPSMEFHHATTNGSVVKSSSGHGFESVETETTTADDDSATAALLRKHSQSGNNNAVLPNGSVMPGNNVDADADEDDDDDDINDETTALTSSNKELVVSVDESKI